MLDCTARGPPELGPANKPTELSDDSVCTTWGTKGGHLYLLHVLRERLDCPALKRAVVAQARLHRARTVVIEDKAWARS